MAGKRTVVEDLIDGVKKAAAKIGEGADEATGADKPGKLYERIIPIPHINVYSEIPFELVEQDNPPARKVGKTAAAKKSGKASTSAKVKRPARSSAKRKSKKT